MSADVVLLVIAATLMLVTVVALPLWLACRGSGRCARGLERGQSASATVLSFAPTGMAHGATREYEFVLEVAPAGHAAFEGRARRLVDAMDAPRFQPGSVHPVKFIANGVVEIEFIER